MIAALAAGVLGQLEGLASISSGVSGIADVLNDKTSQTAAAPTISGPQNGRAPGVSTLSDQLQTLLLQQQSAATAAPGAVQADDVPGILLG